MVFLQYRNSCTARLFQFIAAGFVWLYLFPFVFPSRSYFSKLLPFVFLLIPFCSAPCNRWPEIVQCCLTQVYFLTCALCRELFGRNSLFKYIYYLNILNGLFKTISCFKKCTNRNRGLVCRCCLDKIVALGTRQWRCRRRRACTRSIRRLARWSNECSWSATSGNSFESSSEKLQ